MQSYADSGGAGQGSVMMRKAIKQLQKSLKKQIWARPKEKNKCDIWAEGFFLYPNSYVDCGTRSAI